MSLISVCYLLIGVVVGILLGWCVGTDMNERREEEND